MRDRRTIVVRPAAQQTLAETQTRFLSREMKGVLIGGLVAVLSGIGTTTFTHWIEQRGQEKERRDKCYYDLLGIKTVYSQAKIRELALAEDVKYYDAVARATGEQRVWELQSTIVEEHGKSIDRLADKTGTLFEILAQARLAFPEDGTLPSLIKAVQDGWKATAASTYDDLKTIGQLRAHRQAMKATINKLADDVVDSPVKAVIDDLERRVKKG